VQKTLENQTRWFDEYTSSFSSSDPKFQRNIDLKIFHTKKVCEVINELGKQLNLNDENLYIAELSALFHDIGRFEQYNTYKTFVDKLSIDHAELGIKILKEKHVLKNLKSDHSKIILEVIALHNKAIIPKETDPNIAFFAELLRDADKIDIWRVITEYLENKEITGIKNDAIELGLPDTNEISEEALQDIFNQQIVHIDHVKSLNDFKLLVIGWVFDINFSQSLRIIKKRDYIRKIYITLPKDKKITKAYNVILRYLNKNYEIKKELR